MLYNVSYDIAAVLITAILYVVLRTTYYTKGAKATAFRKYVLAVLCVSALDLITAYTISYGVYVNDFLNVILNSMFQLSSIGAIFFGVSYIFMFFREVPKVTKIIDGFFLIIYILLVAGNLFYPILFTFIDGEYVHGPLFFSSYAVCGIIVTHALIEVIIRHKYIPKKEFIGSVFFLIMPLIFMGVQIMSGSALVIFFGEALSSLVMLFSIETPDYSKLTKAMEDLEVAKEEANVANITKGRFLANMSHEIRTPLNGIIGMNNMILKTSNDSDVMDYAKNVDTVSHSLLSIINDILDFSKIESGNMDIINENYKVSELIKEATVLVSNRYKEKGLKFTVDCDQNIPSVLYGDKNRVKQVLVNLLTNAIKYTKEGFVELDISFSKYDDEKILMKMSVKDSGIGISEEDMQSLFQSFKRLDEKKNRNIEGTGLGLSITSMLLSLMNGTIECKSKYGVGSEFIACVPQKVVDDTPLGDFNNEDELEDITSSLFANYKVKNAKALVVDDVDMNVVIIKMQLEELGFEVDEAYSGVECIEKVKNNTYDLIFMDHMMPEMDGLEALEKIYEIDRFVEANTPVIVLTANAIAGSKEEYLSFGFNDYLAKPVEFVDLYNMVKKHLDRSKIVVGE